MKYTYFDVRPQRYSYKNTNNFVGKSLTQKFSSFKFAKFPIDFKFGKKKNLEDF